MANSLFDKGREGFLDGSIAWGTDTIKVMLVDLGTDDLGIKQVTAASNATPIVVTSTAHGFANGDYVSIVGVLGNTATNGLRKIKNQAANTFELTDTSDVNIAGNGAFTGAGSVTNLTLVDFLDDVSAGRVNSDQTLASKTVLSGVADAADITYTAVTGATVEAIIIYKSTGVESTSRVIAVIDVGTGLPVTPNGGDITVQWDNTANRIFKL